MKKGFVISGFHGKLCLVNGIDDDDERLRKQML